MANDAEQAKKWRDRAGECRRLADVLNDATSRTSYRQLAEAYELLATQEELLGARKEHQMTAPCANGERGQT
jgi:hypothetical protein